MLEIAGHTAVDCAGRRLVARPRCPGLASTPAASTVDHLETSRLALKIKRKVKCRHEPISDSNAEPETSQIATTLERWARNTAYTSKR